MNQNHWSILSWNVNGEGGISDDKIERQLDFLQEHASDVDVLLFQAVNYERYESKGWEGQLGRFQRFFDQLGHEHVHTADWARELYESEVQPQQDIHGPHDRCNLTASRWPIERKPLSLHEKGPGAPTKLTFYTASFPEKLLVGEIAMPEPFGGTVIDIWNVGIIHGAGWGEEKLKMLETVYNRIHLHTEKFERPLLLGGDFNAPKREEPGKITPHGENKPQYTNHPFYGEPYYFRDSAAGEALFTFRDRWQRAERLIFDPEVGEWDMTDAYWAPDASPGLSSMEDYTHVIDVANPSRKRLDHVLVSDQFSVDRCELWNGEGATPDGLGPSDHVPVFVELRLDS